MTPPTVLLKSTIISIPKDSKASLSNSDLHRGISLFNSINKLFDHVIPHYVSNNTSVYSCLLDACKAFDRVHLGKLFSILLHKDIPTTVVRLYFNSYSRQKARVGWNNIMSEYLSVSNGVKQGGVLSSMLLCLYIDSLSQKIETIRCWLPY